MESYRVALVGQRDLYAYNRLEGKLYSLLKTLMCEDVFVEIYVGRNGDFDLIAASVVGRIQKDLGKEKSRLILVLPCKEQEIEDYAHYYDEVLFPECLQGLDKRTVERKYHRFMIERCHLLVCYADDEKEAAFAALKYAKKLHKKYVNLAPSQKAAWLGVI